jgi:hypothetical protein
MRRNSKKLILAGPLGTSGGTKGNRDGKANRIHTVKSLECQILFHRHEILSKALTGTSE